MSETGLFSAFVSRVTRKAWSLNKQIVLKWEKAGNVLMKTFSLQSITAVPDWKHFSLVKICQEISQAQDRNDCKNKQ